MDPHSEQEMILLDNYIETLDQTKPKQLELYRMYKSFRYTGMHSSCLYRKEALPHYKDDGGGDELVVWSRPMKGAEKGKSNNWRELEGVPRHKELDFDIKEYYEKNLKHTRKPGTWKDYINKKMRALGKAAKVRNVTPNSIRHTFLMEMIEKHKLPMLDVSLIAGCTIGTLKKYYEKIGKKGRTQRLRDSGWKK